MFMLLRGVTFVVSRFHSHHAPILLLVIWIEVLKLTTTVFICFRWLYALYIFCLQHLLVGQGIGDIFTLCRFWAQSVMGICLAFPKPYQLVDWNYLPKITGLWSWVDNSSPPIGMVLGKLNKSPLRIVLRNGIMWKCPQYLVLLTSVANRKYTKRTIIWNR